MLREETLGELDIERVEQVTLRGDSSAFVYHVDGFGIRGDTIYILDAFDLRVKLFSRDGALLAAWGRRGRGPGEFVDPMGMTVGNERMFVADPGRGRIISVFRSDGDFVEFLEPELSRTPRSLTTRGTLLYAMHAVQNPDAEGWEAVDIIAATGERVGRGCEVPAVYIEGRRNETAIGDMQFGSVVAGDSAVFCFYPATPVVQAIDSTGALVGVFRLAPPFFRAPPDVPKRRMRGNSDYVEFVKSWTPHSVFIPIDGGFLSGYSVTDETGETRLRLLACRTREADSCAAGELNGQPLSASTWDSVWVRDRVGPEDLSSLSLYSLTFRE